MMLSNKTLAVCITVLFFSVRSQAQQPLRLWYNAPATRWESTVPLGNGRLGAMPDGGVQQETIVLNDITLWSGGPQEADEPDAHQYLDTIQRLLFAGKNIEAQEVMSKHFVCKGQGSGLGHGENVPYGSYQVLGNLGIQYDYGTDKVEAAQYHRELSLPNALATTKFVVNNTSYTREYFTSFDDDVIVIKLSANALRKINCTFTLNRPERYTTKAVNGELQMWGQMNNGTDGKGMQYQVRLHVSTDGGKVIASDSTLQVKDANSAILYISAGTDYKDPAYKATCARRLASALKKTYALQQANHIKKFSALFKRATVELGGASKEELPTDQRLAAFMNDPADNGLPVLYFQYGRYLLISSTRAGLLPPNLQGLWANTIGTPWNGDYHLNINIQMNHWPLEVTNLPMLNEPFYTLVKGLVKPGEKTAKAYYNGKGWVAHVITNIWQYTSPGEHYSWGSFNTGSAWLCQMLWSHYEFTRDTAYLRKLYPILKGSAEFYLSTLVKEPTHGWLVTTPSNSPENAFILPDGSKANVCAGPAMDNQLVRYLFTATIAAASQLRTDATFKAELEKARALLPPNQIAKDGRLMEWLNEYKEEDPHHRHISHVWALYPAYEINTTTTELANAAKATLEGRGDEGTGWSLAWKVNLWARLHEGDHAFLLLRQLLKPVQVTGIKMRGGGSYDNLFCAHPPFQIDGNFGGAAGIAEMLLQSTDSVITFLPALPKEWNTGRFDGLCVRGGAVVSARWQQAQLQQATVQAQVGGRFLVQKPVGVTKIQLLVNGVKQTVSGGELILMALTKGQKATLVFTY